MKKAPVVWQDRIVGYGREAPAALTANPRNWRTHPSAQLDALSGVLREVGVVQNVIVNRSSGHLVDGHARVALAVSSGQTEIPVTYVDLSDEEEALVLATLDPLAAMAGANQAQLDALLRDVETGDAALQELLASLAPVDPAPVDDASSDTRTQGGRWQRFEVAVECASEAEQQSLYERLTEEGWTCRVLSM